MDFELDQYYTPIEIAKSVLSNEFQNSISRCVDTTCGTGNLLKAANTVFKEAVCIGLDKDKKAIARLKKENPDWILSVANLLEGRSLRKANAFAETEGNDLLLLNPPFSHGKSKFLSVLYREHTISASVAMAHVLKSLELFKPHEGAMVILPESVLFSDTDTIARKLLEEDYRIDIIAELDSSTFSGARANATIVKLAPANRVDRRSVGSIPVSKGRKIKTGVVRGALPVYQLVKSKAKGAVPYIHSTDISSLVSGPTSVIFDKTKLIRTGRVSGSLILLPRVGVPSLVNISSVFFDKEIQLSDCVIALTFRSRREAVIASNKLKSSFESFKRLYRGTGARYVTIGKLTDWLSTNGFQIT